MRIKIYGERHTGTKFLRHTLRNNGNPDVWPGTFVEVAGYSSPSSTGIASLVDWESTLIREAIIDDMILNNFERTLGWKHSAVDLERMQSIDLRETKFVVIVKHPVAWALSLYRLTQHNLLQNNKSSIEEFIKCPWPTVRRDNLAAILPSIISSWNLKYAGYLRLSTIYDTYIIRYEDLILSKESGARLSDFLGLSGALKLPDVVRGHGKDLEYYRGYYADEQWRQETSEELREAIQSRVDGEVADRLMYRI